MRLLPLFLLGAFVFATPLSAAPSQDRLPDLGVTPLRHVLLAITADGKRELRFTVSIGNVGRGPIEVASSRPSRNERWTSFQRIRRADGSVHGVRLPDVRLVFTGGSEHGHWHIRNAARYELRRLGDGKALRIHVKRGFCLYDSSSYKLSLPEAPAKQAYPRDACGKKEDLSLAMGISVGWRDDYYWRIPGQELDITTVPNGNYRLFVKADPKNWFRESNERNNVAWADIAIEERSVKVLRRSPRL